MIGDDGIDLDILVLGIFELEFEFGIVSKFRFVRLIEVPSTRSHKSRKNISDLMNSSDLMFVFVVVTLPLPRSDRIVSHIAFEMNNSDLISDL